MRLRSSSLRLARCYTAVTLTLAAWSWPALAALEGAPVDAGQPRQVAARADAGAAKTGDGGRPLLPSGHPPIQSESGDENDPSQPNQASELPPGHPPAGGARRGATREQQLPEDTSELDSQLPAGTIVIEVRDRLERPVAHADVTVGIVLQSVAKGESRRHLAQKTDDNGILRLDGLEFGGGVAYRVTVPWSEGVTADGATYAAPPFQLDLLHGQRVRVHVYPVTNRIEEALVGMQAIVYIELKDDVLQLDELFQIYNVGTVTWVPSDVVVNLPAGFRAFSAQKEMSDTGFDEVPKRGAKLRGTFSPGQHETHFRYQIPYDGSDTFEVTLPLPPHVARMRVIAEASKTMLLRVADFPAAIADRNQRGQRVLVAERNIRTGEGGIPRVRVTLDNIPTEGSAKWIAVGIAAATAALGVYLALQQEKQKTKGRSVEEHDAERARARLVAEIAALDRAHQSGEIGPKAHGRIRDALIDSLARVMAFTGA